MAKRLGAPAGLVEEMGKEGKRRKSYNQTQGNTIRFAENRGEGNLQIPGKENQSAGKRPGCSSA